MPVIMCCFGFPSTSLLNFHFHFPILSRKEYLLVFFSPPLASFVVPCGEDLVRYRPFWEGFLMAPSSSIFFCSAFDFGFFRDGKNIRKYSIASEQAMITQVVQLMGEKRGFGAFFSSFSWSALARSETWERFGYHPISPDHYNSGLL